MSGILEALNTRAARTTNRPWFKWLARTVFLHISLVDRGLYASTWPRLIGWLALAFVWATGLILLLSLPVVVLL